MPQIDFVVTLSKIKKLRSILSHIPGRSTNFELQGDWGLVDEWREDCQKANVNRRWDEIMRGCNGLYIKYKDRDDRL